MQAAKTLIRSRLGFLYYGPNPEDENTEFQAMARHAAIMRHSCSIVPVSRSFLDTAVRSSQRFKVDTVPAEGTYLGQAVGTQKQRLDP